MHWFLKLFLCAKVANDVFTNLGVLQKDSRTSAWLGAILNLTTWFLILQYVFTH